MRYTVDDVVRNLPPRNITPLIPPRYSVQQEDGNVPHSSGRVGLAVESMRRHMTDEGWVLFDGLRHAGYTLHGHDIGPSLTDVGEICRREKPHTLVIQDAREYEGLTAGRGADPRMRFTNFEAVREDEALFRVGVLKDAQNSPEYHRDAFRHQNVHAVVCYYHPRIVSHVAPYVLPQSLVRTYHSVNRNQVPPYSPKGRQDGVLSGAVSNAYPLRVLLARHISRMPNVHYLKHPGYGRGGCATPHYLWTLSRYKVSICTCSRYGYALRKIVEAVACGCVVVTDLPEDEKLPHIDAALVRVHPSVQPAQINEIVRRLSDEYDPDERNHYAEIARDWYDYRNVGVRLAEDIERARSRYTS